MGADFLQNFITGAAVGFADTQAKQMLRTSQQTGAALDKMLETALEQGDAPGVQALMPMLTKRYGKDAAGFVDAAQRKWQALQDQQQMNQENSRSILNGLLGGGGDITVPEPAGPMLRRAPTTGRITGPVPLQSTAPTATPTVTSTPLGAQPAAPAPETSRPMDQATLDARRRLTEQRVNEWPGPVPPTEQTDIAAEARAIRPPASQTIDLTQRGTPAPPAPTSRVGGDVGPKLLDDDYAKDFFRQNIMPQIRGLQPGMSATVKITHEVSVTVNGNEVAAARTRKFLAAGQKLGVSPTAMHDILTEAGLPVQENQIDQYGQAISGSTYRALLPEFAKTMGSKTTDPAVQRAVALETFQRTGYKNDKLPSPWTTEAEARAEAYRGVNEDILSGTPAIQAITKAKLMNTPLNPEDEVAILKSEYGKVFTGAVQRGGSPEQAAYLAGAAVNFDPRAVNPQAMELAFPKPPLTPGTAEQAYIEGGGTRPSPAQAGAAKGTTQAQEVTQAGKTAAARTAGEESVTKRLPTTDVDRVTAVRDVVSVARRLADLYRPNYVGLGQITLGDLMERVGGKTPEESQFRAEVRRLVQTIVRAEAGLSQTTSERANTIVITPMLNLPASAFIPRMEALIADQVARASNIAKGAKEQNYRVPEVGDIAGFNFTREAFNRRFVTVLKESGGNRQKAMAAMKAEGW